MAALLTKRHSLKVTKLILKVGSIFLNCTNVHFLYIWLTEDENVEVLSSSMQELTPLAPYFYTKIVVITRTLTYICVRDVIIAVYTPCTHALRRHGNALQCALSIKRSLYAALAVAPTKLVRLITRYCTNISVSVLATNETTDERCACQLAPRRVRGETGNGLRQNAHPHSHAFTVAHLPRTQLHHHHWKLFN